MKKKNPFRPIKPPKMHSINNQTTTNLLEAILESSPHIIIFALDTQYRYMAFNHGHKQVIQTIWGKEIALGMKPSLDIFGKAITPPFMIVQSR